MPATTIDPRRIEILDAEMIAVLRALTPTQRLAIAFDCNRTMRLRLSAHLRNRHADWTNHEIDEEVARRMLRGAS